MVDKCKYQKRSSTVLFKIRYSSPFLWFMFILAIIMVGFTYVVLSKPVQVVYNATYNDSYVMEDIYQNFFIRSKTIWALSLLVFVISLLFWVLIRMNERNDHGQM